MSFHSRIRSTSAASLAAVLAGGGIVSVAIGEKADGRRRRRLSSLMEESHHPSDSNEGRRIQRLAKGNEVSEPNTFVSGWAGRKSSSGQRSACSGNTTVAWSENLGRALGTNSSFARSFAGSISTSMSAATTLCEGGSSSSSSSEAATSHPPLHPMQHQVFTESLLVRGESSSRSIPGVPEPEQGSSEDAARGPIPIKVSEDASAAAGHDNGELRKDDTEGDDAYPNFSRHGRYALLPAYLTPQVYDDLRRKRTPSGVTIEDCIQAGVALPHGARPPRGLAGLYAGDADSYHTFSDLFVPLLQDYHQSTDQRHNVRRRQQQHSEQQPASGGGGGLLNEPDPSTSTKHPGGRSRSSTASVGRLQRHQTNLNYSYLVKDTLDPEGEYILYTRMRLARSVAGFRFPPCIRRSERRRVEGLLRDVVADWPGRYVSVMDMSNSQHDHLIQQQLLFKDPDDYLLTAGFGRDWPDARGIYCDTWHDTPNIIIWCNAEDHLWIISHGRGGNVQGVFTELSKAVGALEAALKQRGHAFVEDEKYGFLNASPSNIGTALRASVYVKLVRLSRHPGFFDLVAKLRLEARSDYSQTDRRFTGIYDIANAEALGKSEVDLINIMIRGVGFLIELEKKLERGETVDLESVELPAN